MNDHQMKQLFEQLDSTPDDSARAKTVAAALAAFDVAQVGVDKNTAGDQGSADIHRLTPEIHSIGSKTMNTTTVNTSVKNPLQRWLYSGLASAAVLVVGVFIALQLPQQSGIEFPTGIVPAPGAHDEVFQPGRHVVLEEEAANIAPQAKVEGAVSIGAIASVSRQGMPEAAVADSAAAPFYRDVGRDRFESVAANPIKRVAEEPVSTFSIDVDTSSYSFVRRELNRGVLPQKDAVRLEEMVNYFPYDYPLPTDRSVPFSTNVTVIDAPWKPGNKLVRIGIQGYELQDARPHTNLVFLLDVSGSMDSPDKLPLVKQSMGLLLSRLQPEDTVAIAVYAGAAGTVLEPTPVSEKQKILAALNSLQAGGSTAGAEGIRLAYQLAEANFVKDGVNRIMLATDGDFNVGINDPEELKGFVERKRESGVFLSVLGFGQGNYHDALMQTLAQNGNGVAAYIDTLGEAQKVLVEEATSTLFPIASDVKIQVEFNPVTVSEYRLLGYETRILAEEDFNNDAVDAGDIGAGHSVTALYEITPAGGDSGVFANSRYAESAPATGKADEYGFLKLRYKLPGQSKSRLISQPIPITASTDASAVQEARFASAVAGFAELLKGGKYTGSWSYQDALQLALANRGEDRYGYRAELAQLIRKAEIADAM
jgi:Ca-activated chloride channel homolog